MMTIIHVNIVLAYGKQKALWMNIIVNVKNNLVITAVNDTKNAVFTNIDGAIIN